MTKKLKVGTTIYGFAGGLFGRDSYEDKTVIESGYFFDVPWAVLAEMPVYRGSTPHLWFLYGKEDTQAARNYRTPLDEDDDNW